MMCACRTKGKFPSLLTDAPTKLVSLVVPAYKEEKRIGVMLDEMMGFLEAKAKAERCVRACVSFWGTRAEESDAFLRLTCL